MKVSRGKAIYREIGSQPQSWRALLPQISALKDPLRAFLEGTQHLLLSGCGSGLNAARYGAPLLQMTTGRIAQHAPAIDLSLFPEASLTTNQHTASILLSRSGRTTEVVNAMRALQAHDIPVLGITCSDDSPLAKEADLALILEAVTEEAVTTTRSFTGMLITLQTIAAVLSEDEAFLSELQRLPEVCESILSRAEALSQAAGGSTRFRKFAFLGNGLNVGLAHEAQLKIKETTLLPADAYPMLDFRHGPQSTVSADMLLVAMLSKRGADPEWRMMADMQALGVFTFVLCDRANPDLQAHADSLLEFQTGWDDRSLGPLYLPVIHYLAYYRSLAEGLDPDKPPNLAYWIDTSK
jgi:glucosamine--fructose-6-phosphate aminotransferase (isomerizing)